MAKRQSTKQNTMRSPRMSMLHFLLIFLIISCHNQKCRIVVTATEESNADAEQTTTETRVSTDNLHVDSIEDSMFDPLSADPSCGENERECYSPPESTIELETRTKIDGSCFHGGDDYDEDEDKKSPKECSAGEEVIVDKHWGSDPKILKMRDQLRAQSQDPLSDSRPPIFLMPGLASTRLVAWKVKKCSGAFASDIKVQDNVWLNINLVIQMGTVNVDCMKDCLKLGLNQSDNDDWETGCKLRPDEGLDAIASLAPGGIGSSLLVGGTNTVYAWLIQWLADNLGYDVTNIIGLPYDWRLSPDKMEDRDGFLSMTRRRIEAAVASNGQPGIMVAHSMGNVVFRYFMDWLRVQMREESYTEYVRRSRRRAKNLKKMSEQKAAASATKQPPPQQQQPRQRMPPQAAEGKTTTNSGDDSWASNYLPGWMTSAVSSGFDGLFEYIHPQPENEGDTTNVDADGINHAQLWQLAVDEGDTKWLEWLEAHIWSYVGLSAPMLGATNPMRAVISGENMGLPMSDEIARDMEVTFGSTHTINPVSTTTGFCDEWDASDWGDQKRQNPTRLDQHRKLACLDDIMNDIELSSVSRDPWKNFPALKKLMRDRIDWDTGKPMVNIEIDHCQGEGNKKSCKQKDVIKVGPKHVEKGEIFNIFSELWPEKGDPLIVKREQLEQSFFNRKVVNILNQTWDRPLIKHVIMAYGVDIPTEVGYIYRKTYQVDGPEGDVTSKNKTDGIPHLKAVLWEEPHGEIKLEQLEVPRGGIADHFIKKKVKKEKLETNEAQLAHSGDGSVPYLSLSWAHTWLLHAARAKRVSEEDRVSTDQKNALDHIEISHRPLGAMEWVEGPPPDKQQDEIKLVAEPDTDTGTDHPHGTRYKPEMIRYSNVGISRTTGIEYTTSVMEAIGVEHKETTRNYDILAAVFTEMLKYMHDDLGLV